MRDAESTTDEEATLPTTPTPMAPTDWTSGHFAHERLDVFVLARAALTRGDKLARRLPRGYSTLSEQLRRALLSTHLGIAEAASRTGADRLARFRCARGEAAEAAAALDAVVLLKLASAEEVQPIVELLRRVAAMLTRLGKMHP